MPESVQAAAHKPASSFANLLASLTGKLQNDDWDDSALADDVTTLTYEQALRATRSSRTAAHATDKALQNDGLAAADPGSPIRKRCGPAREEKHRGASITIRVTADEHAQLRERAAAAQLSVSGYLRSCIFDAETLRSQVKEALAGMQSMQNPANAPAPRSPRNWRSRFFPGLSQNRAAES